MSTETVTTDTEPQPEKKPVSPVNAKKYAQLMANLKHEMKRLSRNDIVRNYVELFAQFMLMQKQNEELRTMLTKINELNNKNETNTKSEPTPESEVKNEIK